MNWIDVRCPSCNKLLLKVLGLGSIIEVKCARCEAMVTWPSMRAEIKAISQERQHDTDSIRARVPGSIA